MRFDPCISLLLVGAVGALAAYPARAAETPERAKAAQPLAGRPSASPASDRHTSEVLYLNFEAGPEYVGLESLHLSQQLVPTTIDTVDVGPAVGVGAGVRVVFLTLGPRFRYGHFRDWDLWTLGAEIGVRVPLDAIEPWISVGAGYAKIGNLPDSRVRVRGYDARLAAGLDYYFNKTLSIGATASGEILGLTRPGVNLNKSTGSVAQDVLAYDGSAVGFALMAGVVTGIHL